MIVSECCSYLVPNNSGLVSQAKLSKYLQRKYLFKFFFYWLILCLCTRIKLLSLYSNFSNSSRVFSLTNYYFHIFFEKKILISKICILIFKTKNANDYNNIKKHKTKTPRLSSVYYDNSTFRQWSGRPGFIPRSLHT